MAGKLNPHGPHFKEEDVQAVISAMSEDGAFVSVPRGVDAPKMTLCRGAKRNTVNNWIMQELMDRGLLLEGGTQKVDRYRLDRRKLPATAPGERKDVER